MNFTISQDLFRTMLDAVPALLFVVDDDLHLIECNQAAAALLQQPRESILRRRGGEVLRCLHAKDSPAGCGRGEECRHCLIRQSVKEAYAGNRVVRRRAHLQLENGAQPRQFYCLVTATPFDYEHHRLVLLVLEDISQLTELQRIVPICMNCRKVRDDDEYWRSVESYFNRHWDLRFSHGLCPECTRKELEKLNRELPPNA
ncbi:PAS domain-containing protein [Fontisphaera persica]|uniref:PAS domain-containing protein n=1 Tax=Fontisphaera persica TaxID=2974023 RepID=UPI0024C017A1|nr:PAS domain-containing protein [Fontisphaera persica]WCJ61051.1 PAS domain-containing protein [Fontisphaera persica]